MAEKFIKDATKVYPTIQYDYSKVEYKDAKTKVIKEAIRKAQLAKQNLEKAKKVFTQSVHNVNKTKTSVNAKKIREMKAKQLAVKNAINKAVLKVHKEVALQHQVNMQHLEKSKNNEIVQLKKIYQMIINKIKGDLLYNVLETQYVDIDNDGKMEIVEKWIEFRYNGGKRINEIEQRKTMKIKSRILILKDGIYQ